MKNTLSVVLAAITGLVLLTIAPACRKEVVHTVVDTVRPAWRSLSLYNNTGMTALASYNQGDTTLLIGGSFGYTLLPVNREPSASSIFSYFFPGTSITSPVRSAPFLNAYLCAYPAANSFYVESVPVHNQNSSLGYTPAYTAGNYSLYNELFFSYPEQSFPTGNFPVIRNKYGLVPVETVAGGFGQLRVDLVSFDSSRVLGTGFLGPDTMKAKPIILSPGQGTVGFSGNSYFCASYFDKFFVYLDGQFFRIDTLGNVKAFGYAPAPVQNTHGVYNMFTYGSMLFVNSGGVFFASTDQGESWFVFNDFSNTNAGLVVFRNIGTDLYATLADLESQLWKVVIVGRSVNFSELNTDGIAPDLMTSITRCGKYVFITTRSGVFYRDSALFNQLKKPVR